MDLTKIYKDLNCKEKNILEMVKTEPEWAANKIQEGEKAIGKLRRAEIIISDIHDSLTGHNYMVSGYHLNDALEPLDNWFDDNDWDL